MHPPIRTYGRMHGRATLNWPFDYSNPPSWFTTTANLSPSHLCGDKETILEVGFGMGDSLFELALAHPEVQFIGVEVYEPGVLKISKRIADQALENLLIVQGDALECLQKLPPQCLNRIHVFFPDPWPKIRHHKRRLHRGPFFNYCQKPLMRQGHIHLATDIPEYALDWYKHKPENWQEVKDDPWIHNRKQTKYESRGEHLGHLITDLVLIKNNDL